MMDQHELADVDAFQVLLTGHVQVSDPLKTDRRLEHTYVDGPKWLKPLWLELDNDPYRGDLLASHKWIRPINAPLDGKAWERVRSELRARGFNWTVLPESAFIEDAPAIEATWKDMLSRGLGSMRTDGTRNGKLVSFEINCHTRGWMAEYTHRGSFLFRPEPLTVTWAKFAKDFPNMARSFRTCGRANCDGDSGGGGMGRRGGAKRGKGRGGRGGVGGRVGKRGSADGALGSKHTSSKHTPTLSGGRGGSMGGNGGTRGTQSTSKSRKKMAKPPKRSSSQRAAGRR